MPDGFLVRILDGPAAGWEYVTFVEPDPVIAVAPHPSRVGDFMRVLLEEPMFPDSSRYVRVSGEPVELVEPHVGAVPAGPDGEQLCVYRHAEPRQLCQEEDGFVVSTSSATFYFPERAAADFYADWSSRYTGEEMIVLEIMDGGGLNEVARYGD